jgi:hypothetical protein
MMISLRMYRGSLNILALGFKIYLAGSSMISSLGLDNEAMILSFSLGTMLVLRSV